MITGILDTQQQFLEGRFWALYSCRILITAGLAMITRPRLEALVVCDAPEAAYHLLSALKVDGIEDASVANPRAGRDRCLELPATNPK
jgi:hypothetical protein